MKYIIYISLLFIVIYTLISLRRRNREYKIQIDKLSKSRNWNYGKPRANETQEIILPDRPEIEIPDFDTNDKFHSYFVDKYKNQNNSELKIDELLNHVIQEKVFVYFNYDGRNAFVKPIDFSYNCLRSFCYIENIETEFYVSEIKNPIVKEKPIIIDAKTEILGKFNLLKIINYAIQNNNYMRILYFKPGWNSHAIDYETGEYIDNSYTAEESLRTLKNVDISTNLLSIEELQRYKLNKNYITAYCCKRKAQRTFKIDRIKEISVLNIKYDSKEIEIGN